MPWSSHSSSVFTLRDEGFWICLEGVPHHLWNVDTLHIMLGDFAELLEVDMSLDHVKFLGFARLKVRLNMGKELPKVKYFAIARQVYPIRFCRSWDLCLSSSSAWGAPSFSMGSSYHKGFRKPPSRPNKSQKNWKGGNAHRSANFGKNVWTRSSGQGRGFFNNSG